MSLARKSLEHYFKNFEAPFPDREDGVLGESRGVFVTLEEYPTHELRGCIGYPLPTKPLAEAVVDNMINAAFEDPRFEPVLEQELPKIVIEVSVLTVPELIKVKSSSEFPNKVKVGEDGLIVKFGYNSGLLLPQVAPEQGWNSKEFLSHCCLKAGLPKDMWMSGNIAISKFQAQIFSEEKPGGKVIEKKFYK